MPVTAAFGTAAFDNNQIHIPVTLTGCAVEVLPRSTVHIAPRITHLNDNIDIVDWTVFYIADNSFKIICEILSDVAGGFKLDLNGAVFCKNALSDLQVISAEEIDIAYDATRPVISRIDIPRIYEHSEIYDIVFEFSKAVEFREPMVSYLEHFIFEGADLGTPTLYRKRSNTFPTEAIGVVGNTDKSPPPAEWEAVGAGVATARIYLLRWESVRDDAIGAFNLHLKNYAVVGMTVGTSAVIVYPTMPVPSVTYGSGSVNFSWAAVPNATQYAYRVPGGAWVAVGTATSVTLPFSASTPTSVDFRINAPWVGAARTKNIYGGIVRDTITADVSVSGHITFTWAAVEDAESYYISTPLIDDLDVGNVTTYTISIAPEFASAFIFFNVRVNTPWQSEIETIYLQVPASE